MEHAAVARSIATLGPLEAIKAGQNQGESKEHWPGPYPIWRARALGWGARYYMRMMLR